MEALRERHLHAIQRAAAALEANDALRDGVGADQAVDILYALAGTEVYRWLVHDRGWNPDQYVTWLFNLACRELLAAPLQVADSKRGTASRSRVPGR